MTKFVSKTLGPVFLATAAVSLASVIALAQDDSSAKQEKSPAKKSSPETKRIRAEFDSLFQEWKYLLQELGGLRQEFRTLKSAEGRKKASQKYNALMIKGRKMAPKVRDGALKVYQNNPTENEEIEQFLAAEAQASYERERLDDAIKYGRLLALNQDYKHAKIFQVVGMALFHTGQMKEAEDYLKMAMEHGVLDPTGQAVLAKLPDHVKSWDREQELRAQEAEAGDLPRVLLKTTKGDVLIELFENEAPNTVANFVSLVEQEFYTNLKFHRVLRGFMAQAGCPKGTGAGGPGYSIDCECHAENHRVHFRGSLSMAHAGENTGGSQFYICFRRVNHLDGKHTVFGRVLKGMDVVASLQPVNPDDPVATVFPDKILEATIIRKREHEYQVKKNTDDASDDDAKK
ncbi:MAG: peptidylprolyl isomerase [Planctomycetales bacterium]